MTDSHSHVVAQAILPVAPMQPAIDFYRRLGFDVTAYDPNYAWVSLSGHELFHLRHVPELDPAANASSCYLQVDDVDGWHAAWSAADSGVGPVADQPWEMREFAVRDPSGNLVRVGQHLQEG